MSDVLEVVFHPELGEPYLQKKGVFARKKAWFGSKLVDVQGKWYRVGLINHRETAIENVSVSLIEAGGLVGLPLNLLVKDQRGAPTSVVLNPSGSSNAPMAYCDVLFAPDSGSELQVLHAISGVKGMIPKANCDLVLLASGADIDPVSVTLRYTFATNSLLPGPSASGKVT